MENESQIALVVNNDGEIISSLNEGDRIVRKKSVEYLADTMEWMQSESFVKVYATAVQVLPAVLNKTESAVFNYLLSFIRYDSGLLAYSNGRRLTRESIADGANMDIRTIDRVLLELREKKIIGIFKTGREIQFYMNPYIASVGTRINKTLYEMFKNSDWARLYIREEKRKHKRCRLSF